MICPYCGKKQTDDAKRCERCKAALKQEKKKKEKIKECK